jgi:hypothetical protein
MTVGAAPLKVFDADLPTLSYGAEETPAEVTGDIDLRRRHALLPGRQPGEARDCRSAERSHSPAAKPANCRTGALETNLEPERAEESACRVRLAPAVASGITARWPGPGSNRRPSAFQAEAHPVGRRGHAAGGVIQSLLSACHESFNRGAGPNSHRAKLNPPTRIITTPAILPLTSPNGIVFSSRRKMATAAIHNRFITPPTKSNPIRIQQQPTQ